MSTLHLQPSAAPVRFINSRLAVRAALLGLTIDAYQRDNAREYNNEQGALYPEGATQDARTKRTRVSLGHSVATPGSAWFDSLSSRIYIQDSKVDDLTRARYISGQQPYLRNIATGFYSKNYGIGPDAAKRFGPAHTLAYGASVERTETCRRRPSAAAPTIRSATPARAGDMPCPATPS